MAGHSYEVVSCSKDTICFRKRNKLKAEIVEVTFINTIKASLSKAEIIGPHWKKGMKSEDGDGSLFPVVYKTGELPEIQIVIEIKATVSDIEEFSIETSLHGLTIKGTCRNEVGKQTITLKAGTSKSTISHCKGDATWIAKDTNTQIAKLGITRLEIFFILDTPAKIYQPAGVWIEALRALCKSAALCKCSKKRNAAAAVALFCHSIGFKYDTINGAPWYGGRLYGTKPFNLSRYLKDASSPQKRVNCYDQAAAVQTLCGAIGVNIGWVAMDPYGQINETNLVGIGLCNNPFFESNGTNKIVHPSDPKRTGFGNHAFTDFEDSKNLDNIQTVLISNNKYMIDACAGPHMASETFNDYLCSAIDTRYFSGGTKAEYREGIVSIF
jgi:hypothetical protein